MECVWCLWNVAGEEVGLLLDRMEETASQLQSVSENTMDMDRRQQISQIEIQQNKEQLQTAQSDLLMLRSENSELTQKFEVCSLLINC